MPRQGVREILWGLEFRGIVSTDTVKSPAEYSLQQAHLQTSEFSKLSGRKALDCEKFDFCADEPKRGMPNGSSHSTHLPVFPFTQSQLDPAGRDILAESYRHGPWGNNWIQCKSCNLCRPGPLAAQDNAFPDLFQVAFLGYSFDLHKIGPCMTKLWISQSVLYERIVGEEEQSLTVCIQSADRIDIRRKWTKLFESPVFPQRRELGSHAVRFVEEDVPKFGKWNRGSCHGRSKKIPRIALGGS